MSNQYRLDYEGQFAELVASFRGRLSGIDRRVLRDQEDNPLGLSHRRWSNLRECLMAVFSHAGGEDSEVQKAPADLQATAKLKSAAWYTARNDAIAAGLLSADPDKCPRTGRNLPDRLSIDHKVLEEYLGASRRNRRRTRRAPAPDLPETGRTRPNQVETRPNAIEESLGLKTLKPPPPSPALQPTGDASPPGPSGWGEVLEMVEAEGVGCAAAAIEAARSAGVSPGEVAALVEHYRAATRPAPPAWGPGALAMRIKRQRPGVATVEAWPPPNEEHTRAAEEAARQERRAREAKRYATRRRESETRAASIQEQRAALEQLRERVVALPPDELDALVERLHPFTRRLARRDPQGPVALGALAELLGEGLQASPGGADGQCLTER